MKYIATTLLVLILITTAAKAQFAIEGGVNASKLAIKLDNNAFTSTYIVGASFGMLGDLEMDKHVYFEPGLFYQTSGTKLNNPKGQYLYSTYNLLFNIEYKTGEKCGHRFFAGAGPNIIFNNSGSYDYSAIGKLPLSTGTLKVGSDRTDDLKQRALALGLNVGYLPKKHFYVRANFLFGLSNMKPVGNDKNSIKTSGLGLNLGWYFGNCKSRGISSIFARTKNNHWRGLSKGKYSTKLKY